MSIKVLLIVPPVRLSQKPTRFPLGIGYIAAILEKDNFDVTILELNILRLSKEDEEKEIIKAIKNVDIVGTGGMITSFETISNISSIIKENRPNLPIIVGGSIASHLQEIILRNSKIDILIIGEGELNISKIIKSIIYNRSLKEINGIAYIDQYEFIINPQTNRIKNLDLLPMPAYHLFSLETYIRNRGENRTTDIIGSRGCPFKCTFCHRNFGNQVVFRSIDSVMDEIRFLKIFYNITNIYLEDELFVQRKDYVSEFCEKITELGEITWSTCTRVNTIDSEIAEKMKDSGCQSIMLGLETFNNKMLEEMNKGVTVKQNEEACKILTQAGIAINPGLIIGMPGETKDSIQDTINGCIREKISINEWSYAFATPYPGTKLYNQAKAKGIIKNDLTYIKQICDTGDTSNLAINLSNFTDEELIALRNNAILTVLNYTKKNESYSNKKIKRGVKKILNTSSKGFKKLSLLFNKSFKKKSPLRLIKKEHFTSNLNSTQALTLIKKTVTMVEIEIFSYCNRQCWFCSNSIIDRHSKNNFMSDNIYLKVLKPLKEINYKEMISYSRYNEPLANDIIYKRLKQARDMLPKAILHLNTNGDYLDKISLKNLYNSGLRSLNIQVYFNNNEKYSDENAAKKIMQKINKLKLPYKFKYSKPMSWLEYNLFYKNMDIRIYSRNFSENMVDRGGVINSLKKYTNRESPCLVLFNNIYIDYNGQVVPCCNIRSDYDGHKKMILGDLNDPAQTFSSIFTSAKSVNLRKKLIKFGKKDYPCTYCLFLELPKLK